MAFDALLGQLKSAGDDVAVVIVVIKIRFEVLHDAIINSAMESKYVSA